MTDTRAQGIINMTCQAFNLTLADIMAHDKNRYVSKCRRSIMLALRDADFTYMAIAILMGRDISTVAQGIKTAKRERNNTK